MESHDGGLSPSSPWAKFIMICLLNLPHHIFFCLLCAIVHTLGCNLLSTTCIVHLKISLLCAELCTLACPPPLPLLGGWYPRPPLREQHPGQNNTRCNFWCRAISGAVEFCGSFSLGCTVRSVRAVNVVRAAQKMQKTKQDDSSVSKVHHYRGQEPRGRTVRCACAVHALCEK